MSELLPKIMKLQFQKPEHKVSLNGMLQYYHVKRLDKSHG